MSTTPPIATPPSLVQQVADIRAGNAGAVRYSGDPLVSIPAGDGKEIRLTTASNGNFVLSAERGSVELKPNWLESQNVSPEHLGNVVKSAAVALGLTAKRLDPETYIT